MLPPERGRAMLGARPPRRRAGAIRRTTSAGAGDAVEAAVGRAGIRRRVGPQARQPRLDTREAVSRIVAFTKEPDLLNTQEPREGGGVRLGGQRLDAASKYAVAFSGRAVAAATRSVRRRMRDSSLIHDCEQAFYANLF